MRRITGLVLALATIFLIFLLGNSKWDILPLGKMLSPTHGFWTNASDGEDEAGYSEVLKTPYGDVEIWYDDRAVPHLFAPDEPSLYYAQGYVQAKYRLWQMDFQVRVAAGRLSEVIGEDGLRIDRYFRRMGLPRSAEQAVAELSQDSTYLHIVDPFTKGVNRYVQSLRPADYPLEYKLTDSAPEEWNYEKCVLLLKLMSFRLSGSDTDVSNTNTLRLMGRETFDFLFPVFPADESPIIPQGTSWPFDGPEVGIPADQPVSATNFPVLSASPLPSHRGIGSNNWAVGRNKALGGGAILCNDPHLGLSFPSIWFEMQLHTPGMNVYGVTIPGAPCIVIGFNEDIAWGVTNGSRDVRDWYSVQYRDETQREYLLDSTWFPIDERVEVMRVRNGKDVVDTVRYTRAGPIMYDGDYGRFDSQKGLAMQWLGLDVSNELKTFYQLNHAADHADYLDALKHFDNPAQNFVYADRQGNVAIKEQGKFKVMDERRNRFVEPLADQRLEDLYRFIPDEHNPYVLNPPRGFVSSANQHPTDSTYPYLYSGWFERYRNRRINYLLDSLDQLTVEDMMRFQNDNYNLMGEEMLPGMIALLDPAALDEPGQAILDTLQGWNFRNEYYYAAPAYFQQWWKNVKTALWDELIDSMTNYREPLDYETWRFLEMQPDHPFVDRRGTDVVETVEQLVRDGFNEMVAYFNTPGRRSSWRYYNNSNVTHLLELPAFSADELPTGGSENALNANFGNHGPSWRMIVRLTEDGVKAWGVYPGGQQGNPASPHYRDFLDEWTTGSYFQLHFFPSAESARNTINQQP